MKNILLSLAMLVCLSASSQNDYRLYSKLGLDLMAETSDSDYNMKKFTVIPMTIETAVQTKWKSGVPWTVNSRSSDEMKLICLEGYITKIDFNAATGFSKIELSSKTGAKINCYFPVYDMEMMLENVDLDVEENRAMFRMDEHYNAVRNNKYRNCNDATIALDMFNGLDIGVRYKIAEKNKVKIYGFLLLDANNKAEIQPMIEITWKDKNQHMKKLHKARNPQPGQEEGS